MFVVTVDVPGPRRWIGLNEMFLVPEAATSAFLEDAMSALSEVTRRHQGAMLGGETLFLDQHPKANLEDET